LATATLVIWPSCKLYSSNRRITCGNLSCKSTRPSYATEPPRGCGRAGDVYLIDNGTGMLPMRDWSGLAESLGM